MAIITRFANTGFRTENFGMDTAFPSPSGRYTRHRHTGVL